MTPFYALQVTMLLAAMCGTASYAQAAPACTAKGPRVQAQMERSLGLTGYHRMLHTTLKMGSRLPKVGAACVVSFEDHFPHHVFVDAYQVQELSRMEGLAARLDTVPDLEVFAEHSKARAFSVHMGPLAVSSQGVANVSLPVHMRYQAPRMDSTLKDTPSSLPPAPALVFDSVQEAQASLVAWVAHWGLVLELALFGEVFYGGVEIPKPQHVTYQCGSTCGDIVVAPPPARVTASVPIGNARAATWVVGATLAAAMMGALAVMWAAMGVHARSK